MNDGGMLQCARVDRLPDHKGSDHALPNVIEGSRVAGCCLCRQRVWISRAAWALAKTVGIKPVCDDCHPATNVTIARDLNGRPS